MPGYDEPIGQGGIWVKEGKSGKFLSWKITFAYNGHQVDVTGLAFKNEKQEGQQPNYRIKVLDAYPSKSKEMKTGQLKKIEPSDNLPF